MSHLGVAYGAVVMLGYDRWLQMTWKRSSRELHLPLILMLTLLAQGAVLLLAAVLF
jgi:hypothetical protein